MSIYEDWSLLEHMYVDACHKENVKACIEKKSIIYKIFVEKFSKHACLDICGVCPSIYLYKITLKFR